MEHVSTSYLADLLGHLGEPKCVWGHFLGLTQIPRGSNFEGEKYRHLKVLEYLKGKAESLKCETYVDAGENLIIRKKAFPGLEKAPVVCLQCHMDMVAQKDDATSIDFDKDPITPFIENGYVKAKGTTLGADNGIGVAAAFAVLESTDMKHGPIEVLVTRDEETGMYGAVGLEPNVLKAKYMLNLDSEEESAVCTGSAGGFDVQMKLPTPRESKQDLATTTMTILLNDFVGGHTGVDIHLGRANPMHVMGRLLKKVVDCCGIQLVSFECGTANNAIPRKCECSVSMLKEKVSCFRSCVETEFSAFYGEYKSIEHNCVCEIRENAEISSPVSHNTTVSLVNFLNVCPFAVMRMSPTVAGVVETSMTCAVGHTRDAASATFNVSVRSFSSSQLDYMYAKLCSIAHMAGMSITEKLDSYPGWYPKPDSELRDSLVEASTEVFGKKPRVYAIHAGLECGLLLDKYPELDCASIGPVIVSPHSPSERMLIESVPRFYSVLVKTLEHFGKK